MKHDISEVWSSVIQLYCLPALKNVCSRDLELNKETPFFATSNVPLVLVKAGAVDSLNTRMMNVRWRF